MGAGWKKVVNVEPGDSGQSLTAGLVAWGLGCVVVYGALFSTGYLLYGQYGLATVWIIAVVAAAVGLFRLLPRLGFNADPVTDRAT